MIDPTNSIPNLPPPAGFVASLNAWHLVALGAGIAITHAFHTVVNGGGYEMIWRRFRFGPTGKPPVETLPEKHD